MIQYSICARRCCARPSRTSRCSCGSLARTLRCGRAQSCWMRICCLQRSLSRGRYTWLRCIMFLCVATWCSVQAMAAATAQRHTVRQTTTDAQRRRIAPRSTAAHWLVLSGDGGAAARLQADTDAQRPDAGLSSVRPHRRAARALAYQPLNAAFAELSRAEPSRHVMRCERLPHDAMLSVWIAPCV